MHVMQAAATSIASGEITGRISEGDTIVPARPRVSGLAGWLDHETIHIADLLSPSLAELARGLPPPAKDRTAELEK